MDERPRASGFSKTAACACGALSVTATAEPATVHACTCLDCQRMSGSALSYTAFFAETATTVAGEFRAWRRIASSGRWNDSHFCPVCGSRVFTRMEALPGLIGIAAGCFADPDFAKPGTLFWSSRRHRWLPAPDGVEPIETQ